MRSRGAGFRHKKKVPRLLPTKQTTSTMKDSTRYYRHVTPIGGGDFTTKYYAIGTLEGEVTFYSNGHATVSTLAFFNPKYAHVASDEVLTEITVEEYDKAHREAIKVLTGGASIQKFAKAS